MGIYNTFVADSKCPACGQMGKLVGQFKWGALILATYHIGDKLVWDQSEMHLLKDQLKYGLFPDSGLTAGERSEHLIYQCPAVECAECRNRFGYMPFNVLLEFKKDILTAVYPVLDDDAAHTFLTDLLSGRSALAVAGAIPELHEQVANIALFNRALVAEMGKNIQSEHGLIFLRALGTISIYWAHQLARPKHLLVRLDSDSVDKALTVIARQIHHPEYANDASKILEEVSRVKRESESLRKMQP